jgi:predicted nucleic acid-binding protein
VDRVFLDANVLFSAARSPTTRLRKLWLLAGTQLLASGLALDEARRNLAADRPTAVADLDVLAAAMTIVPEPDPAAVLPSGIDLPAGDRPIFLAAVSAQATHFVTGDRRHFRSYRGQSFANVLIVTPADYLDSRGA